MTITDGTWHRLVVYVDRDTLCSRVDCADPANCPDTKPDYRAEHGCAVVEWHAADNDIFAFPRDRLVPVGDIPISARWFGDDEEAELSLVPAAPSDRVPGAADEELLREVGEALHKGLNCGADEMPCPYCRRLVTPVLAVAARVLAERLAADIEKHRVVADAQELEGMVIFADRLRDQADMADRCRAKIAAWCGLPPEGADGGGEGG